MTQEKIYRGDLFFANLNPVKGSEQGGKRPVVILQNDVGNKFSPTVIVAAITSRTRKKANMPTHVPLDNAALEKDSQVLLEQIRTLDKTRLIKKVGKLTQDEIAEDYGIPKRTIEDWSSGAQTAPHGKACMLAFCVFTDQDII